MSDPISLSIDIALTAFNAIKAGAAIGQWWETRKANQPAASPSLLNAEGSITHYRQSLDDIYLVLATLGQRLLFLDVIDHRILPEARNATLEALAIGDPEEGLLRSHFEQTINNDVVQYAISCAMVFCAECWPMHMWQGFGCGVMNFTRWASLINSNNLCSQMDDSIAALKSKPHDWQLLKKSASRIGQFEPYIGLYPKPKAKMMKSLFKDLCENLEKRGFTQPLPPRNQVKITNWSFVHSSWAGDYMYSNVGHGYKALCTSQSDPGKFLYAWTVGRRAELRPGEAIYLAEDHIRPLAEWLEGLNGMSFKIFRNSELDYSAVKFKYRSKKFNMAHTGNELGVTEDASIMVLNPDLSPTKLHDHKAPEVQVDLVVSPPSSPPASPLSPLSPVVSSPGSPPAYSPSAVSAGAGNGRPTSMMIKRRPVPQPPPAVVKMVTATHAFKPMTEQELGFEQGDSLEILDDTADDGWWKARLGGKTGMIPNTFVKEA